MGEDGEVSELGSGSGLKTHLLLEQLRNPRAYIPIDVARKSLEQTAVALASRFPKLCVFPVHADFTAALSLPSTGEEKARRVVYFPGSTIGNFSPREAVGLLCTIARIAGVGGGLVIGFDLDKTESIVCAAYNI